MVAHTAQNESPHKVDWSAAFVSRLNSALEFLAERIVIEVTDAPSHRVITLSGWVDDAAAERAIAEYLVGLRMMMVSAALQIQGNLLGTQVDSAPSVRRNVEFIVGSSNSSLSERQIVQERNPWIAEAIWHLCLHISRQLPSVHPIGSILAVDYAHSFAKEQGLDVAALYISGSGCVGLTIVETKAYEARATQAVIDAAAMFRAVNEDKMDVEVRRAVSIMRGALPPEYQQLVTGTFWKDERTCIPNPHYDPIASAPVNWTEKRSTLTSLGVDSEHVLLMPHCIPAFREFFARIANNMRIFAEEMAGV